jgi:hypothetical protein
LEEIPEEAPLLEEFNAREALAFGAEFVKTMAPADTTQALAVATFLMEYAAAGVEHEHEPDEADEADGMPAGPVRYVQCSDTPTDGLQLVGTKSGWVCVRIVSGGTEVLGGVVLTAKAARSFAAGLLDAADEADGSSPLLMFQPPKGGPPDVTPQAA